KRERASQSFMGECGSSIINQGRAELAPGPDQDKKIQWRSAGAAYLVAGAAVPPFSFLHSLRNFLRSLPCRPLASASLEHSIEVAVRGFSAFSVFAGAGAAVCAKVGVVSRSEAAKASPSARVEMAIIEAPMRKRKEVQRRAIIMNRA